ncbi:MAG TPA: hypothetical protein VGN60_05150 [Devosia sp.]|jgi:hypothetical protein|nr:hypothetical protein [Devosia sp.]
MEPVRTLADVFTINRHFQKSTRIDADLVPEGLEGYRLNQSGWQVLKGFAEDVAGSKQRAFTWTGPYGSGKSSLALMLAALLGPAGSTRKTAERILGPDRVSYLRECLPAPPSGWMMVTVVGQRTDMVQAIWSAFEHARDARWQRDDPAAPAAERDLRSLLVALEGTTKRLEAEGSGLLLLIDEMGKLLEHAALSEGDLFPLQEIAEVFARVAKRAVLLGVLHQAFGDYGRRVSATVQAEWAKIQGRFSDTPFSMGVEEVVGLVASAIDRGVEPSADQLAKAEAAVDALAGAHRAHGASDVQALARCAPLHPVTALLLGPVSRRRFGQNERSVFSFLSSHEPFGFYEFLTSQPADSQRLFEPADLWDYLQINHEPAILASSDGAKWAEAAEAVLRASRRQGSTMPHVRLAKAIALLDMFGRSHGVAATDRLLACCCDGNVELTSTLLGDLQFWSVAIPRRHIGGWGLFAGSDLDLDAALVRALERISGDTDALLKVLRDLPPVVAKRHYAKTGTLRLLERRVVRASELERAYLVSGADSAVSGAFLLVLPEVDLDGGQAKLFLPPPPADRLIFRGTPEPSGQLIDAAREVAALERLPTLIPQLHGDPAARRELNGRLLAARATLADAIRHAFDRTEWQSVLPLGARCAGEGGLSALASELCESVYPSTPELDNELLNRERPSPAAVAARRRLLQAMISRPDAPRLGIAGEPAELGLYLSLLAATGVHRDGQGGDAGFGSPTKNKRNKGLEDAWSAAELLLAQDPHSAAPPVTLEQVYAVWRAPPFGMRAGVMPVFALALYLTHAGAMAAYVEGNYVPEPGAPFVERMLQEPQAVSFRWVGSEEANALVLERLAPLSALVQSKGVSPTTALGVAKPLVQFALRLPGWTRRTRQLSPLATQVRDALLASADPYELLFQQLPTVCGIDFVDCASSHEQKAQSFSSRLQLAVKEMDGAQQRLLEGFEGRILRALHAEAGRKGLIVIAERASALSGKPVHLLVGRFAQILADAPTDPQWLEALCGLAASRPLREWTDGDVDRCRHEVDRLCQKFIEAEASVIASAPDSEHVRGVAAELRAHLHNKGLDPVQQRAALLLALEQLAPATSDQEAA